MRTALIGATGFLGQNLVCQINAKWAVDIYTSKNIHEIANKQYDIAFIAAPSANKWLINQGNSSDLNNIHKLIGFLREATLDKVIHYSTIDVFQDKNTGGCFSEAEEMTLSDNVDHHLYGQNRSILEDNLKIEFKTTVIRLPALFGAFLKKNLLFDFKMKRENLKLHNIDSIYQYYNVKNLFKDTMLFYDYDTVNLVSEPIFTQDIVPYRFHKELCGNNIYHYNVRTKYSPSGYFYNKDLMIREIKDFLNV